jgi:hypothetical protein
MNEEQAGSRLGRPPIDDDDTSVGVHVKLPSKQYDDAYRQAQRRGISVPELIRRQLHAATKNT